MDKYVKLAKYTIEHYLNTGKIIKIPNNLPNEMIEKKAGTFVSIHKKVSKASAASKEGELRGCIGTILPTKENIAQEIIDNAISACSRDYRFAPIKKEEIPDLEISVDVLSEPESIMTSDLRLATSQLDTKKYGVIVKSEDGRTGLLLPDIPGIDTPEYQLAIARQKAGISPNEPVYLFRFEVVRHKIEPHSDTYEV